MKERNLKQWLFACIILAACAIQAYSLKDPAAVYCTALGYDYALKDTSKGQVGICKPATTLECDEWDFLRGKCGLEYSFCEKGGYGQIAAIGKDCGSVDPFAECLVCVLPDGRRVEVAKLMGLDYNERSGGASADTTQGKAPETSKTAPHDRDQTKDGVKSEEPGKGIDESTTKNENKLSVDASQGADVNYIYLALLILAVAFICFIAYRRLKK